MADSNSQPILMPILATISTWVLVSTILQRSGYGYRPLGIYLIVKFIVICFFIPCRPRPVRVLLDKRKQEKALKLEASQKYRQDYLFSCHNKEETLMKDETCKAGHKEQYGEWN